MIKTKHEGSALMWHGLPIDGYVNTFQIDDVVKEINPDDLLSYLSIDCFQLETIIKRFIWWKKVNRLTLNELFFVQYVGVYGDYPTDALEFIAYTESSYDDLTDITKALRYLKALYAGNLDTQSISLTLEPSNEIILSLFDIVERVSDFIKLYDRNYFETKAQGFMVSINPRVLSMYPSLEVPDISGDNLLIGYKYINWDSLKLVKSGTLIVFNPLINKVYVWMKSSDEE